MLFLIDGSSSVGGGFAAHGHQVDRRILLQLLSGRRRRRRRPPEVGRGRRRGEVGLLAGAFARNSTRSGPSAAKPSLRVFRQSGEVLGRLGILGLRRCKENELVNE